MPRRFVNLDLRPSLVPCVQSQWTGRRKHDGSLPVLVRALLARLTSAGQRTVDYRRVAADSLITVQFQENVSLDDLLGNVRTINVL